MKKSLFTKLTALLLCAAIMLTGCKMAKPISIVEMLAGAQKYLTEMNYDQAIVEFENLIKIEPKNISAYLGAADAYLNLDRREEAVELLKSGVEATDNDNLKHALEGAEQSIIEGYIAIAEAYEAEGFHELAEEILRRVYNATDDEIIGKKLGIVEASVINFRDDYVIEWKDAEFERLIREYLGKESGDVHYDDVKLIDNVTIFGEVIAKSDDERFYSYSYNEEMFRLADGTEYGKTGKIKTLEDLKHFTSLTSLTVTHQNELSIDALSDTGSIDCLNRLKSLKLISDNIENISVVSYLNSLSYINLDYNNISDISPISMLIELESIDVSDNHQLTSIEPLRGLRKLSSVGISGVGYVDLNALLNLEHLKTMHISSGEDTDYSLLTKFNLDYLEISCNEEIFQTVKQLNSLTNLRLHGSELTNISGIESLTNLKHLDLLAPNCHDISSLSSLNVEYLEIDLPFDCDLSPLTQMPQLKQIEIREYHNRDREQYYDWVDKIKNTVPDVEVIASPIEF